MCATSVILDMFKPMPDSWYNQDRIDLFKKLLDDAKQFDIETDQPDCEDPEKAKLESHILEIESELKKV